MSRLLVFKDNILVLELPFEAGKVLTAGRSKKCDLVLEADNGVSREHFKIYQDSGAWILEDVSRYGELYKDGAKIPRLILKEGEYFEVPPYRFEWKEENEYSSESLEAQSMPSFSAVGENFGDKTFVGQLPSIPFLKVFDNSGRNTHLFRLEGHSWVVGRDTSCTVFIDYNKISRKQFEIQFQEGVYLIRDLGSSNGTLLNGVPLSHEEWSTLNSGDVISIVDWSVQFELRDASFEQRLLEVSPELRAPPIAFEPPAQDYNPYAEQAIPQAYLPPPGNWDSGIGAEFAFEKPKKNYVRLAIIGLVLAGVVGYVFEQDGGSTVKKTSTAKAPTALEQLSTQQQQYIKDTYNLADSLFKQGRYEMARQEVIKIHQILPSYLESKNIEKLSEVAIQTQLEQQQIEARERERLELEEKVERQVAECNKLVDDDIEKEQIENCLGPVLPLAPEHPKIVDLRARVDDIITTRAIDKQKRAEYNAKVARRNKLYDEAESIYTSGEPLKALDAYEKVVSSKLPDPKDLKSEARRKIASIQQELADQQAKFEAEAEAAQKSGDLKKAINALNDAVKINPENEVVKGRLESVMKELRKQMQTYYQEGILEESVGEVETAKSKWRKIRELSVPGEEYYEKATIKLKKYGSI